MITLTSQLNVFIFLPMHTYGLLYADGQKGTNIFTSDAYMTTAFDFQRYGISILLGHLLSEIVYDFYAFDIVKAVKTRSPHFFMLLHHVVGAYGLIVNLYYGGVIFTLNYLLLLIELTNTNNHIRMLTSSFDLQDTLLYKLNGVALTIVYFIFRVCWLTFIMFTTGLFSSCPGFKSFDITIGLTPMELLNARIAQYA